MHLIVTGGINSGKTTRLRSLAEEFAPVKGFLCPKVFRQERCIGYDLQLLPSGETHPFIRKRGEEDSREEIEEVLGEFLFYRSGFSRAEKQLNHCLPHRSTGGEEPLVFVDELGLLEEQGRGFFPAVKQLVDRGLTLAASIRRSSLENLLLTLNLEPCQWIEVD